MKFQECCVKDFDSVVRARGQDEFETRRVRLETGGPTVARFELADSNGQAIEGVVDWSASSRGGHVQIACSCRTYARGESCEHLWAALLELDRLSPPELAALKARPTLIRTALEEALAAIDSSAREPVVDAPLVADEPSRLEKPAPREVIRIESWRDLSNLDLTSGTLESALTERPVQRRAVYVVNLDRSRQTGCLAIDLRQQEKLKSGEWGVIRSCRLDPMASDTQLLDVFESPEDQALLGLLLSPLNSRSSARSAKAKTKEAPKETSVGFEVDPLLMDSLASRLVATERLLLEAKGTEAPLSEQMPLSTSEKAWSFELVAKEAEDGVRIEGVLKREREKIPLLGRTDLAILDSGWVIRPGALDRVEWEGRFELARSLCAHAPRVPVVERDQFVANVVGNPDLPPVQLPPSLVWPLEAVAPQAIARLVPTDETLARYTLRASIAYGSIELEVASARKLIADPQRRIRIKRDSKAERTFFSILKGETSLEHLATEGVRTLEIPKLVEQLHASGWKVEIGGQTVARFSGTAGQLRYEGEDFVLTEASFEFEGARVSFAAFFASCARGEWALPLTDARLGLVPEDWIRKIDLMLRGAKLEAGGTLRFKRSTMPLFRPIFEESAGLRLSEEASAIFASLERLIEPGTVEKPAELKAQLRSYQGEGLAWLESIAASGFGGILADDMGLGKTIQVIAYLLRRATVPRSGPRPSLVVLPKSLVFNWIAEIEKFGPRLRVLDFAGPNRGLLRANDYDVVVTTYHVLKNELDRFEKIEFDSIVIDEAQAIKNPGSQVAQAVFALKGRHRFALSGTPIENSLVDLFSLLRFANPGLIPAGVAATIGDGRGRSVPKETLERLAVALKPFVLRRTKKQVLKELPDKTEQPLYCEMEGVQKRTYDSLRRKYREALKQTIAESGLNASKMQVLEALLRMRQACCHPALVDETLGTDALCAKFDVLLEHLDEIRATGNKALVFSQFTSFLNLLKPRLEREGIRFEYLDGQTRDRGAVVERFNSSPDTTVFLISLKAGGTGLNLTTASYVFLLDPWWNPAIEAQAIDRAYRMGQKQKVTAYRLIAQGTIEEKILRLQAQKRSLAESVISDDPTFIRSLSVEDLAGLFD